ncbi:hypothetical protein J5N97_013135 [Dioscorea zingiberensis]|uniref:Uncharacterized protein n=1 Tax=Dioscorea zingiberensis TaxID=325984 RepID=A0A9D5CQ53_9LILI|nr:hypothetical protein J5N97_013135 [Dioscorea zingiberensis]
MESPGFTYSIVRPTAFFKSPRRAGRDSEGRQTLRHVRRRQALRLQNPSAKRIWLPSLPTALIPALEDAVEFGRIGRYYAAESMLLLDQETGEYSAEKTPSYGKDTLEDFFQRVIREGMAGQELGEQTIF